MTLTVQSKLIDIGLAIADIKQCWIDVARNGVLPERKLAIDLCVEETYELIDAMNAMVAGYRDNNQEMLAKAWNDILDAAADMLVVYSQLGMVTHPELTVRESIRCGLGMLAGRASVLDVDSGLQFNQTVIDLLQSDDFGSDDYDVDPLAFWVAMTSAIYEFESGLSSYGLINFGDAIKEVSRSNWSKFPSTSDIADPEAECKWIEENSKGRYHDIKYRVVELDHGSVYVFYADTGKVVKPSCFSEPNFKLTK